METPNALLRRARSDARLSIRALAQRADVSASTVARIEAGHVDPTFGMLTQLLDAAGYDLRITARRRGTRQRSGLRVPRPRIADLATAWKKGAFGDAPDWTRFRGTLDQLALHPNATARAIRKRPPASGSPMIDALLAGIAEKLADDSGRPRPAWTQQVPALVREWAMPGTPQMIESRRGSTPPQLRDRGLVLDEASLWRSRATVGV